MEKILMPNSWWSIWNIWKQKNFDKIGHFNFNAYCPSHIFTRQERPNSCLCVYHEDVTLKLEGISLFPPPNYTSDFVKMINVKEVQKAVIIKLVNTLWKFKKNEKHHWSFRKWFREKDSFLSVDERLNKCIF